MSLDFDPDALLRAIANVPCPPGLKMVLGGPLDASYFIGSPGSIRRVEQSHYYARFDGQEWFAFGDTLAEAVGKALERLAANLDNGDYGDGKIPEIRQKRDCL